MDKQILQEAFNRVVTHLRKQGRKSCNSWGGCVFRSPEGYKCAVGIFLTDEFYEPWMDQPLFGAGGLELHYERVRDIVRAAAPNVPIGFLNELRYIHDMCEVAEWEIEWIKLARQEGLTMPAQVSQEIPALV